MMPKVFLFVALASLLALVGCNNKGGSARRPMDKGANPNEMVQNAVESRTALSSISGKGVMRIVDQPSKFGLTVNADVVADENDRLRIKANKLAGAIQAFDVVMLGDDIGFYIPTQKTLYHGKVEELRNFSFRFDPDEVLQQMLRPDASLAQKDWRRAEGKQRGEGIVLEEDVKSGPRMRVTINSKDGTLASVVQLDAQGQPVFVKKYDDYRDLSRGRKGSRMDEDGSVFPYLISFAWPRDRRSMEMHFKQVEGNAVVSDDDFDIAASSDTKYRPLGEAQVDADFGEDPVASRPRDSTDQQAM